ncbi:MAG: hypothetical protein QOI59_6612 [Gammaproteobacteria bacterium]|nr:hypothetical protein [Gammaproteobacteria bacterium]
MTPVIVAIYDDFGVAERVRTELVADGFPTDRVELTSKAESGQADAEPGDTYWHKVSNYFHAIFDQTGNYASADQFADRVRNGGSAITVHPRTDYEMDSARTILQNSHPVDFREHVATT